MKKKILLITQWFDPEPTFKGLLFAKELVLRGYDVEVLTGFPNYPGGKIYSGYKIKLIQKEYIDGVSITRLPLYPSHSNSKLGRALNYLSFAFAVVFYGLFIAKKANAIYAYHPPLTIGIAAIIIKFFRKIPVVYDIQDLWPDTLHVTGMVNNTILLNFISRICNLVYSAVDNIVVLSPGFKKNLINKKVPSKKISVIYNWADEKVIRSKKGEVPQILINNNCFNILFAGNIGRAQKLETVLEAAKILKNKNMNINFILIGQGLMLDELKNKTIKMQLDNVFFIPEVPMSEVGAILTSADALLIHLKEDPLFKITIPGKTQAYMEVGKPIIMGVQGNAADIVNEAKCGIIVEPENANSLAEAAESLFIMSPEDLKSMGDNSRTYYDKNLSVKSGIDKFIKIFDKLI